MLGRAAVTAFGAWLVCLLVVAATDEGGVAWVVRLGRSLMMAPICAAVGAGLTLSVARATGELRALAAIGRPETESSRSTVVGAMVPPCVLALLALVAVIDVSSFFPRPDARKAHIRADAHGFVDDDRGLRIDDAGVITVVARTTTDDAPVAPTSARLAVVLTVLLGSVAFAKVASLASGPLRRRWIGWSLAASAGAIAAFQIAAASRASPLFAPLALAVLLAALRVEYRRRHE
jgi:hypothetical protein